MLVVTVKFMIISIYECQDKLQISESFEGNWWYYC